MTLRLLCILSATIGAESPVPGITAATGNGALTAAVDAQGRVAACRWPAPSHFSQLGSGSDGGSNRGLQWAIDVDGSIHWLLPEEFTKLIANDQ